LKSNGITECSGHLRRKVFSRSGNLASGAVLGSVRELNYKEAVQMSIHVRFQRSFTM